MKRAFSTLLGSSLLAAGMTFASPAFAVPNLQLDILGGSYDGTDESIFTTNDLFTLSGYCSPSTGPNGNNCTGKQHFISIAILDQSGNAITAGTDFGSFSFNGITYGGVGGNSLVFGTPPLGDPAGQDRDPGDLAAHSVFPTLFTEVGFNFTSSQKRDEVNTQDTPGTTIVNGSGNMFYQSFSANMSGLKEGYRLHFDLYNEDVKRGDLDVDKFAPFSHDAYAKKTTTQPPEKVPEPTTLAGLALMVGGLAVSRRRKASQTV